MSNKVTWIEALKALQEGHKIRKHDWTNSHLYLLEEVIWVFWGNSEQREPFETKIDLSQEWEIIEEPRDFAWALEQMNQGLKVRRRHWEKRFYICFDDNDEFVNTAGWSPLLCKADFAATDWGLYTTEI